MIEIRLLGSGECEATHGEANATLRTSKSPAYGGLGGSFSATDLLAAALGTCIATDIEPVARRHGVRLETIQITVEKELGVSPKRLASLRVRVRVPASTQEGVVLRLRRAAGACLVQRSLSTEVEVRIDFERKRSPPTGRTRTA